MMGNNQNLFFSPEEKGRAFSDVLKEVQEYISSKYSTLMVEGGNDEVKQQVKRYISKYIADYRITVKGKTSISTRRGLIPKAGASASMRKALIPAMDLAMPAQETAYMCLRRRLTSCHF